MAKCFHIVHPCFNPTQGWEKELVHHYKQLIAGIPEGYVTQLVLVNDGSTRGIHQEHLHYLRSEVPHFVYIHIPRNSGKGFALRYAIKEISEGGIIYTDVDHPYRIENTLEMISSLNSNSCDVVVGVRTMSYFKSLPLPRVFLSIGLRFANFLFFPALYTKDTQSGLKAFNQKGREVFLKTKINGFLFDTEFLRLCARENLRVKSIRLQLNDSVCFSPVRFATVKQEIRNFIQLVIHR